MPRSRLKLIRFLGFRDIGSGCIETVVRHAHNYYYLSQKLNPNNDLNGEGCELVPEYLQVWKCSIY